MNCKRRFPHHNDALGAVNTRSKLRCSFFTQATRGPFSPSPKHEPEYTPGPRCKYRYRIRVGRPGMAFANYRAHMWRRDLPSCRHRNCQPRPRPPPQPPPPRGALATDGAKGLVGAFIYSNPPPQQLREAGHLGEI